MENEIFFTKHYNLNIQEKDLEFIDIPLNTDIKKFVDPYAISKAEGVFFVEANNLIVDFFEHIVNVIRDGDDIKALSLMDKLREPNETRFGLSQNKPEGRGVGNEQSKDLLKKFKQSKALQTGYLSDLSDCELLIPGIGSDKISDITINIIRGKLVDFTEQQCKKHGIPVSSVKTGHYWDDISHKWTQRIAMLPNYNGKMILLVPKFIARGKTISNYLDYYNKGILPFLQDYHLDLNTSLVKTLKNGKRRVTKKDLRAQYKCSKDFVLEFSAKNPTVLQKYKNSRV